MSRLFLRLEWKEVLPRVAADFLIVQTAFVGSLLAAFLWRVSVAPNEAAQLLNYFGDAYRSAFWLLSLSFPTVFWASGFYTRSRGYASPYKWRTVLTGSSIACLLYLFANFLLDRASLLPRSAALVFVAFVNIGVIGARQLKDWIVRRSRREETESPAIESGRETDPPVLVVGGAGYIGSIVCRKLLAQGRRVRVLDKLLYGEAPIRELLRHPRFELHTGDCRNIKSVVHAVSGAGSIIHLAAIVGDPACEQDRQSALEVNYAATRMLIEIAKGNRVERFVFASSCSVYGASEALMEERSRVHPISLYAETKVDSERALLDARTGEFHPAILRFATVFGYSPRPRFDLVVNLLTGKARNEGVITIYNGEQWRPFVHVDDVAEAILRVLDAPLALVDGEIYNVGDSRLNYRLSDVADFIRLYFPLTRVEHVANTDRRNYRVSFSKIRNRLGFECARGIEDGIREIKEAFDNGKIRDHMDVRYHNLKILQEAGSPQNEGAVDPFVMAAFASALLSEQRQLSVPAA
jgi:nucleoside-diphosphate-sugar epimerase